MRSSSTPLIHNFQIIFQVSDRVDHNRDVYLTIKGLTIYKYFVSNF